jgi:radical SAM superfamily enzyme YgiQ (UPF0313 family)
MKKNNLDIIFVHPPATLKDISPIADADTKYGGQFSSLPVGIFNMGHNLDRSGYKVRILNLAERYIHRKQNETLEDLVKSFLQQYDPAIVGIDLHFMPHIDGTIETAKLFKENNKKIKVILGGFTASFFADEILEKYYDIIDGILVGECDECIVDLVRELNKKSGSDLNAIPNFVYKRGQEVKKNKITVPHINSNSNFTRYDLLIDPPITNPDRALITMCRGCRYECNYCGGARDSYKISMKRDTPILIDPEIIVQQIKNNMEQGRKYIYIYGDIRDGGGQYISRFFKALFDANIKNSHIVFEFFYPAAENYLSKWHDWRSKTNNTLETTLSVESGNFDIRKQYKHKKYSNENILDHCELVMSKFKIPQSTYFSLGLPHQTRQTSEESLKLAEQIIKIYAKNFKKSDLRHEIIAYCFFQLPDVGSLTFRHPEKFGYEFDFKGFAGLRDKISTAKDWTEAISYTTPFFKDKSEIIETYKDIKKKLSQLYEKHGLIDKS